MYGDPFEDIPAEFARATVALPAIVFAAFKFEFAGFEDEVEGMRSTACASRPTIGASLGTNSGSL